MVYETGAAWAPALQIDPVLPVGIRASLLYPDGRTMSWQGTADAFGSYAGSTRATLDVPGVYRYFLEGEWQGFRRLPGSADGRLRRREGRSAAAPFDAERQRTVRLQSRRPHDHGPDDRGGGPLPSSRA
jgi:hypothetical protein